MLVWRSMVELYGPSFVAAYGEKPSPLWQAAISDLTDDECRIGLTSLAKQPREYPANLTQFVAACRPAKGVRYYGTPTTPAELRRLELPKANPSVAERHLANMRRAVGAATRRSEPKVETPACTCQGLGECEVCREWSRRMLEFSGMADRSAEVLRDGESPTIEAPMGNQRTA